MSKTIVIPLIIMLIGLSACSPSITSTPAATPSSGIEGSVTQGPMCPGPVPAENNTCPDKPYQATIIVLDASQNQVLEFKTDPSGHFKVDLTPGSYVLHPISEKTFPHAADQTIVVIENEYTQVTIQYDTGMR